MTESSIEWRSVNGTQQPFNPTNIIAHNELTRLCLRRPRTVPINVAGGNHSRNPLDLLIEFFGTLGRPANALLGP